MKSEKIDNDESLKRLEQIIKDLQFEKNTFLSQLDAKEIKLLKKKEKIINLRLLITEIREKLNEFNDKDLQNRNLLKMKENQL